MGNLLYFWGLGWGPLAGGIPQLTRAVHELKAKKEHVRETGHLISGSCWLLTPSRNPWSAGWQEKKQCVLWLPMTEVRCEESTKVKMC